MASQRAAIIPPEELAYMAGYFDAEGCIAITRRSDFRIGIVSRDFASLLSFARYLGGKIRTERRKRDDKTDLYWAWYLRGSKAQSALKVLAPLLRGKRQKALMSLTLTYISTGHLLTEREQKARLMAKQCRGFQ